MSLLKWMLINLFVLATAVATAKEWKEHQGNMQGHNARIVHYEEVIEGLLKEKQHVQNPGRLAQITKELVAAHKELKNIAIKKNKELKHMRYRHPARGHEFEKKYLRTYEVKSLQDYENQLGIGGQLTRVKEKIDLHYGVQPEEKAESIRRRQKEKEKEEIQRIRLVK